MVINGNIIQKVILKEGDFRHCLTFFFGLVDLFILKCKQKN